MIHGYLKGTPFVAAISPRIPTTTQYTKSAAEIAIPMNGPMMMIAQTNETAAAMTTPSPSVSKQFIVCRASVTMR